MFDNLTILKYNLIRTFRSPISALVSAAAPIVIILVAQDLWVESPSLGINMLALIVLLASHLSAGLILQDRLDGSVIRVQLSPVSNLSYMVQNLLAAMMPPFIYAMVLAVAGLLLYNWGAALTFGLTLAVLLFAFVSIGFAFFFNNFFKSKEGNKYAFLFVAVIMAFSTGLMLPIEALPQHLQHVGAVFYPFWFLRGINMVEEYGLTLGFWMYQIVMVLFATVFLVLGSKKRGA